jgi:Carboxypeptidase regulatory-like domain
MKTRTRKRRKTTTTSSPFPPGRINPRRIRNSAVAVAAALALVCASTLPAQKNKQKQEDATARTLKGIVFDPEGNPAAQAVVQLKDSRTLQVLSFITLEDGAYHFASLKQDADYQVKATHAGLTTGWKRLSIFDTRKVAEMNLKLTKKESDTQEPDTQEPDKPAPDKPEQDKP